MLTFRALRYHHRRPQEGSTMHSPLVTLDGFPRNDIDVLAVRTARVRILELRNDCASRRCSLHFIAAR